MSEVIAAFGPAFAAGFAVQRLLEIVDALFVRIGEDSAFARSKPAIMAILSLAMGLLLAGLAPLRVLAPLGVTNALLADFLVTALVISAGTEGVNSIVKFLEYAKDNKKGQAALSKAGADGALATVDAGDHALNTSVRATGAPTLTANGRRNRERVGEDEAMHK